MNKEKQFEKSMPDTAAMDLDKDISFPDEAEYLLEINKKLSAALREADTDVDRKDKEYIETKRYMAQYRGEIDPHEMFQNELALKQMDHMGCFAVRERDKIAKLKDSPYFARVDFQPDGDQVAAKHYIGRFSFSHENELLICDWRSPIASTFYDYEVGTAEYHAPMGIIAGKVTRKRQFKIKEGKLIYALESSVNIQDDILQQELSHTSDEKMKSIISTIQKEQNQIIRNEKTGTMIIQGVAGSGKTSIALHRIAFLLYRFKDKLSAKNVTILSPNKVFGDYISNVLPELGEEPICELSFWDIAKAQLDGIIGFEPDKNALETVDEKWSERVKFKSTLHFLELINKYLSDMPNFIFEPADYTCGHLSVSADWIRSRFLSYKYPIKQRLKMLADDIYDRFRTDNFMEDDIPKARTILKNLNAMLKVKDTLSLYKDFCAKMRISDMFVLPAKKTLEWADVFPFLYFHAAFEGLKESKTIRHLVVDEMQDYTPIQYAALNLLFQCEKTILGDFGQSINPNHLNTLSDMRQIYGGAEFVELTKSYRSTYEIINLAKRIQTVDILDPIERHGEDPLLLRCEDKQDEITQIRKMIGKFEKSDYASLGIITKTNSDAKMLYDMLSQYHNVYLLSPESNRFMNGISVSSVQMSKGLEFDEVIIPDTDYETYCTNYDRSLLYIACTRAMHKLALLYTGEQTSLIEGA